MRKSLSFLLTFCVVFLSVAYQDASPSFDSVGEDYSLAIVLEKLGDEPVQHKPDLSVPGVSAIRGADLVLRGITHKPKGGKTSKQSKHFVCTSCHNVQREDPDLRVSDPEERLKYAKEKGLPFLQGTTLYGAVNRTRFYNGDYEKKYGDLVTPARNNLREAIQLCAVECSQGRALKNWEMESVLAYLWTLELKLGDLDLSESDYRKINAAIKDEECKKETILMLKGRYQDGAPATFVEPPLDRTTGYEVVGNPGSGKLIYELSCLHCHKNGRYSFFELDNSHYSFQYLKSHTPKYTRYSIYQVGRYGTSPITWKKAYMPNYTLEKMSDQQMEDLRAYIEVMAGGVERGR